MCMEGHAGGTLSCDCRRGLIFNHQSGAETGESACGLRFRTHCSLQGLGLGFDMNTMEQRAGLAPRSAGPIMASRKIDDQPPERISTNGSMSNALTEPSLLASALCTPQPA